MSERKFDRIIIDGIKNPPQDSRSLYKFVWALTNGEKIPFKRVCKDHQTPWDFFFYSYRIDLPQWKDKTKKNVVAIGPRNGQKTLTVAKLIVTELLTKKRCETVGMGAVLDQANKCQEYAQRYMKSDLLNSSGIITKMLQQSMELRNGSKYDQVCATLAGTNGKHPQKMRCDEVDLVKGEVLEEAKMIPVSKNGLSSQTIYVSTRKFAKGPMDELMENAGRGLEKIIWCWKEVSEKCTEARNGGGEAIYEVDDDENPGHKKIIKAFRKCGECPLLKVCEGDLANSDGYAPIDDAIDEFEKLDSEVWRCQKECKKPRRGDLFFSDFSRRFNVVDLEYQPNLPVDICLDFSNGGESPTTVVFIQEDDSGNQFVLGALSFVYKANEDVAREMIQFAQDLGIPSIRWAIGDSAQQQSIRDLNQFSKGFFNIIPCSKIRRQDGWPLVRRLVKDNVGRRRIFFNSRFCDDAIEEFEDAKRSNSDANDIAKKCRTHFLDAIRYREVKLRFQEGFEPNVRVLDVKPEEPRKIILPTDQIIVPKEESYIDRVMRKMFEDDD